MTRQEEIKDRVYKAFKYGEGLADNPILRFLALALIGYIIIRVVLWIL